MDLYNLCKSDYDLNLLNNLSSSFKKLEIEFLDFEKEMVFISDRDHMNAFLEINSGSGGVDAQDWCSILLKMYTSWISKNGFSYIIDSISYGDISGIKNVSIRIIGKYAFGFLKCESGVHRLVRKSPFDSNNKRHTSFSSVFVYPILESDSSIKIADCDVKIETFRSSGAGGQHVNTTDSAVRITHLPTKLVVQCQSERSQHKNKAQAFKQLNSKLKEYYFLEEKKNKEVFEKNKLSISWGNQIRSYFLDKCIIKDLRTNLEVYNVELVLNGYLDPFIYSLFYFK
jgi:peptide chain release factor 2